MKFLCICQYGHSRSVAMARVLHHHSFEAIVIGAGTGASFVPSVVVQVDKILLADHNFIDVVPEAYRSRAINL